MEFALTIIFNAIMTAFILYTVIRQGKKTRKKSQEIKTKLTFMRKRGDK